MAIHFESQIVGRRQEQLMKQGKTFFEALQIVSKEAIQRERMRKRFEGRTKTAPTVDFDLIAPNSVDD